MAGGTDLALSVRQPVGPDEVREIVGLTNDVYRNHWITYAYSDISRRLHEHIGDNASWCTFSTWSSRLIGQYLRVDEPNPTIEQWLREHPLPVPPLHWALRRLGFWIRTRDGGAMPRVLGHLERQAGWACLVFGQVSGKREGHRPDNACP